MVACVIEPLILVLTYLASPLDDRSLFYWSLFITLPLHIYTMANIMQLSLANDIYEIIRLQHVFNTSPISNFLNVYGKAEMKPQLHCWATQSATVPTDDVLIVHPGTQNAVAIVSCIQQQHCLLVGRRHWFFRKWTRAWSQHRHSIATCKQGVLPAYIVCSAIYGLPCNCGPPLRVWFS